MVYFALCDCYYLKGGLIGLVAVVVGWLFEFAACCFNVPGVWVVGACGFGWCFGFYLVICCVLLTCLFCVLGFGFGLVMDGFESLLI